MMKKAIIKSIMKDVDCTETEAEEVYALEKKMAIQKWKRRLRLAKKVQELQEKFDKIEQSRGEG